MYLFILFIYISIQIEGFNVKTFFSQIRKNFI